MCRALYRDPPPRCPRDGEALIPEAEDPMVGTDLAGRYRIARFLGEGAMGRVYEARHPNLDRRYAVKVMFGDFTANETMRARFAREARAASRLEHPNVVGVVDYGEDEAGLQPRGPQGRDALLGLYREHTVLAAYGIDDDTNRAARDALKVRLTAFLK